MNDMERKRIEDAIAAFMEKRRPAVDVRHEIDHNYCFDGKSIEIFSGRVGFEPDQWVEEAIAKARYVKERELWLVYWNRADQKWHKYDPVPEVRTVAAFLKVVDEDEYCCFFG